MYTNRKKHMRVGVFYDVESGGSISQKPSPEIKKSPLERLRSEARDARVRVSAYTAHAIAKLSKTAEERGISPKMVAIMGRVEGHVQAYTDITKGAIQIGAGQVAGEKGEKLIKNLNNQIYRPSIEKPQGARNSELPEKKETVPTPDLIATTEKLFDISVKKEDMKEKLKDIDSTISLQEEKIEKQKQEKSNKAKEIWKKIRERLGKSQKETKNTPEEREKEKGFLLGVQAALDNKDITLDQKYAIIARYSQALTTPDNTDTGKNSTETTIEVTQTNDNPLTSTEKGESLGLSKELLEAVAIIKQDTSLSGDIENHDKESDMLHDMENEKIQYLITREATISESHLLEEASRDLEIQIDNPPKSELTLPEKNLTKEIHSSLSESISGENIGDTNIPDIEIDPKSGYYFRDEHGNIWSTGNTDKGDMKDLLEFYTQFSTPPLDHLRSRGHVFLEWLYHRLGKKWTQESGGSDAMSPKEMRRYILLALAKNAYPKKQEIQNVQALNIKEGGSDKAYINMIKPLFVEGYQGKPSETLARLKNMGDDSLLTSSGDFRMNKFLSLF